MDPDAAEYSASLKDDVRMFDAVVQINMGHVQMLKKNRIIEESSACQILDALITLRESGLDVLNLSPEIEDIHMAVEEYVEEKAGEETGGKLHTAKSRNDQVSTAIRMTLREEILELQELLADLIEELTSLADKHVDTIMPGYTHLQVAEPTTFAHYLNAYGQAFVRDLERLSDSYEQTNLCPLGACALAGTSFSIDRNLTSSLLGFDGALENTMDATGSRDFALQTMSDLAIIMTDLSRFAGEISLWNSAEFGMIEIPDEFSSTSSIMPQKKNPVITELERAKTGRVVGNLAGGLNIMKNLPQAYNQDLQELTPILWDSIDQTKSSLRVIKKLVSGMKPKPEKMRKNAERGFATMTELANTLVREVDIPFRKSHKIVGKLAANAMENEKTLNDLTGEDLQKASQEITGEKVEISKKQLKKALDLDNAVKSRNSFGGPSPDSVKEELSKLGKRVQKNRNILKNRTNSLIEAKEKLMALSKGG